MNIEEITTAVMNIKAQMNICNETMLSICRAANVELPEHLTGISADAWNEQYKAWHKLNDYLIRIERILNSAVNYININLK